MKNILETRTKFEKNEGENHQLFPIKYQEITNCDQKNFNPF